LEDKSVFAMETKEAIYENGQVRFLDKKLPRKKFKVFVTFVEELNASSKKKNVGDKFVEKWAGFLQNAEIDVEKVKEERLGYLKEKYK